MKFKHNFTLTDKSDSQFSFKSENINIQLNFFNHIMRFAMYKDGDRLFPTFSVCPGDLQMPIEGRSRLSTEGFDACTPSVKQEKDSITFTLADAEVSVELFNFRMKVQNQKGILYQDRDYIAYNFDNELGKGAMHFISRECGEENEEQIFGLGDKTGNVNKNKRCFKMGTLDSMGFDASCSDPLYKQVPFYICKNKAGSYGIFYDTYSNGEMNFGIEHNNYYIHYKAARFEEEALVFYVIFGSVPEITQRFAWMCGRQIMPPRWTLKYCGSTMAYTDAPDADAQLRNYVALCKKYDIKPGGFYLSSGYTQIGEKRYVFNWNKDKIPSPEALAAYFKENGIEFLPNIKPAFLTDHFLYKQIADKGWFLHYKDGTPAVFPFWSGFGSYLDFTNKEAFDFWTDCVKHQLVEKGYKNIWNDNNEYDVCDEEVYADGWGHPVQAKKIRPVFSYLMTASSLAAQKELSGTDRTFSVTRSGIAGLQRLCTTWTGDNNTSFDDFRFNHKMAMTMSISGLYNFGQDIGGFAGPRPSKELFLRWIQYGLFTPRFVLHSWNPDGSSTMPWLYEDAIPAVKRLFDLREQLLPYLYNQVYRSYKTFNPIIYPVFFKYPDYDVESDFFFFGDDILACPVFDKGAESVKVHLPEIKEAAATNATGSTNAAGSTNGAGSTKSADSTNGAGSANAAAATNGAGSSGCSSSAGTSAAAHNTCACGIYIPNGTNTTAEQWYFRSSLYSAGDTVDLPCEMDDLPVYFVRAGSVIPQQQADGSLNFAIYAKQYGTFDSEYFNDDGITKLSENKYEIIKFHVECKPDAVYVQSSTKEKLNYTLIDGYGRKLIVN